jgi:hypothetical protein
MVPEILVRKGFETLQIPTGSQVETTVLSSGSNEHKFISTAQVHQAFPRSVVVFSL